MQNNLLIYINILKQHGGIRVGFYKVNKELGDLVNDNVRKLESIFPSVVKDGEVDFEELK